MTAGRTVRLSIDSDLADVRRVRRAINELAGAAPFSREVWLQIKTCVAEAVNNAIIHAYGREKGHAVEVEIEIRPALVVCRIADRGRPMPEGLPHRPPSLDFSPQDVGGLPEGGMGLFIMHQVMDRVEYASRGGRNELTLTKFAPTDGAG